VVLFFKGFLDDLSCKHEPKKGPYMLDLNSTIRASEDVVVSQLDDELVMMSIEKGQYYGLDDIGSRVWELINEPRSISSICDVLVSEFDVVRTECEHDMVEWLSELAGENLIQIVDGQET
tara:strand:- start:14 stop:373 length:360 start_codon:yes stop_codon:yes gene_type:complete